MELVELFWSLKVSAKKTMNPVIVSSNSIFQQQMSLWNVGHSTLNHLEVYTHPSDFAEKLLFKNATFHQESNNFKYVVIFLIIEHFVFFNEFWVFDISM